jgi:hypothetical protein
MEHDGKKVFLMKKHNTMNSIFEHFATRFFYMDLFESKYLLSFDENATKVLARPSTANRGPSLTVQIDGTRCIVTTI